MGKFNNVLDKCLDQVERGQASLEECLERYPEFADQLRPALLAAQKVPKLSSIQPNLDFKQKARKELLVHMRANPHGKRPELPFWLPRVNFATTLAALALVVFASTTAFAQYALPGNLLYGWKRASENVWRAVSPDLLYTDLALADRRLHEYIDPEIQSNHRDDLLQNYANTLNHIAGELKEMPEQSEVARAKLEVHQDLLNESGVHLGTLDDLLELLTMASETPGSQPDGPDAKPDDPDLDTKPAPSKTPDQRENGRRTPAAINAVATNPAPATETSIDPHPDAEGDKSGKPGNDLPPPAQGRPPDEPGPPRLDKLPEFIRDFLGRFLH